MDYAPHARDLYDGRIPDTDMVGFCVECDLEILAAEPVWHDIHDRYSVTLRCVACQTAKKSSAA